MTEHTPGPWSFDGDWHRIPTIYGAGGEMVASVEKDGRKSTPERAANARLIASAPDLLAALTELSAMYSHAWDRVDGGLSMFGASVDRFEKAHYAAQVAIAAAEGKPPPVNCDEEDHDDDGPAITSQDRDR